MSSKLSPHPAYWWPWGIFWLGGAHAYNSFVPPALMRHGWRREHLDCRYSWLHTALLRSEAMMGFFIWIRLYSFTALLFFLVVSFDSNEAHVYYFSHLRSDDDEVLEEWWISGGCLGEYSGTQEQGFVHPQSYFNPKFRLLPSHTRAQFPSVPIRAQQGWYYYIHF